jgi:hypothetical protein
MLIKKKNPKRIIPPCVQSNWGKQTVMMYAYPNHLVAQSQPKENRQILNGPSEVYPAIHGQGLVATVAGSRGIGEKMGSRLRLVPSFVLFQFGWFCTSGRPFFFEKKERNFSFK